MTDARTALAAHRSGRAAAGLRRAVVWQPISAGPLSARVFRVCLACWQIVGGLVLTFALGQVRTGQASRQARAASRQVVCGSLLTFALAQLRNEQASSRPHSTSWHGW